MNDLLSNLAAKDVKALESNCLQFKQDQCSQENFTSWYEAFKIVFWSKNGKFIPAECESLVGIIDSLIKYYPEKSWQFSDLVTYKLRLELLRNQKSKPREIVRALLKNVNEAEKGSYHYYLLEGLRRFYLGAENWREYFSIAGVLFRRLAQHGLYSNHMMRGVQFILSDLDISIANKIKVPSNQINWKIINSNIKDLRLMTVDSVYFDRFSKFVISQKHLPVHIHIINPRPEQIKILDDCKLNYSYENIDFIDKKPYFISSRFILVQSIIDLYPSIEKIVITDFDSLFTEKIASLLNLMDEKNYWICSPYNKSPLFPWSQIGGGLFVVNTKSENNKALTKEFFSLFAKCFYYSFDKNRNPRLNSQWWIDQGILASLIDYSKQKRNILQLDSYKEIAKYIYFPPAGNKEVALSKQNL